MAEKIQFVIGGDNSQGLKALMDTRRELARLRETAAAGKRDFNGYAAGLDAVTRAQQAGRGSAQELAASWRAGQAEARQMAGSVGALNSRLVAMRTAAEHARVLTGEVNRLATGMIRLGTVGAVGVGLITRQGMGFGAAMSDAAAKTRATRQEYQLMADTAKRLGMDRRFTQFSATDVAETEAILARGGMRPRSIIGGAAEAATLLGGAGGVGADSAATGVLAAKASFRARDEDLTRIVDQMAAAANSSDQSMEELIMSVSRSASAVRLLGRESDETLGILAMLADNQIKGELAGTQYQMFLQKLTGDTKEAREVMERYSLTFTDARGNFLPMIDIAGQLQRAFQGVGDAEKMSALGALFDMRAKKLAAIMVDEGTEGLQHYIDKVNQAGYASEVLRVKNDNLRGDWQQLRSTISTGAVTIAEEWDPVLRATTNALTTFAGWLTKADSAQVKLTGAVVLGAPAMLLLGGAILKVHVSVVAYRAAKALLTATEIANTAATTGNSAAQAVAATRIERLLALATPWRLALGGIAVGVGVVAYQYRQMISALDDAQAAMMRQNDLARQLAGAGYASSLAQTAVEVAQSRLTKAEANPLYSAYSTAAAGGFPSRALNQSIVKYASIPGSDTYRAIQEVTAARAALNSAQRAYVSSISPDAQGIGAIRADQATAEQRNQKTMRDLAAGRLPDIDLDSYGAPELPKIAPMPIQGLPAPPPISPPDPGRLRAAITGAGEDDVSVLDAINQAADDLFQTFETGWQAAVQQATSYEQHVVSIRQAQLALAQAQLRWIEVSQGGGMLKHGMMGAMPGMGSAVDAAKGQVLRAQQMAWVQELASARDLAALTGDSRDLELTRLRIQQEIVQARTAELDRVKMLEDAERKAVAARRADWRRFRLTVAEGGVGIAERNLTRAGYLGSGVERQAQAALEAARLRLAAEQERQGRYGDAQAGRLGVYTDRQGRRRDLAEERSGIAGINAERARLNGLAGEQVRRYDEIALVAKRQQSAILRSQGDQLGAAQALNEALEMQQKLRRAPLDEAAELARLRVERAETMGLSSGAQAGYQGQYDQARYRQAQELFRSGDVAGAHGLYNQILGDIRSRQEGMQGGGREVGPGGQYQARGESAARNLLLGGGGVGITDILQAGHRMGSQFMDRVGSIFDRLSDPRTARFEREIARALEKRDSQLARSFARAIAGRAA